MKLDIIYEDNNLIVIDKPAGIAVHAPADQKNNDKKETVVSILQNKFPAIKNVGENSIRPGVVHRLDKETSGLMVIAKNNETFYELKQQFQQRKVIKKYIALVSGSLENENGIINIPLAKFGGKTKTGFKTKNSKFKSKLKLAITEYKVTKRFAEYTLVEVTPKTGRQHQIRVHFASINHPVTCDKLYGRKSKKCPQGLNRHFLHASYLSFQLANTLLEFDSDLPLDLKICLKNLT